MKLLTWLVGGLLFLAAMNDRCEAACPSAVHQTGLASITLSPDGTRIAALAIDGTLFWWDVASGKRTELMECADRGNWGSPIVFSPDSSQIAVAMSGAVRLFDVISSSAYTFIAPGIDEVEAIAFSADGRRVAAAHKGGVSVWIVGTREPVLSITQKTDRFALALSREGGKLLVVGKDGIDIWDVTRGQVVRTIALESKESAHGLAFAHGDQWIVGAIAETLPIQPGDKRFRFRRRMVVWEAATGQKLKTLPGDFEELARPLSVSNSGTVFASSYDHVVRAWDIEGGRLSSQWTTAPGTVSADGRFLVREAGPPGRVELWKVGESQSDVRSYVYRSPLCDAKDSGSTVERKLQFRPTILGNGFTDDGHSFGFSNLVAQDCTELRLDHYYFPSEERSKKELHRVTEQATKVLEHGPPKSFWEQGLFGERAVLMFAGSTSESNTYSVTRTKGTDFYLITSYSLTAILEFEKSFFSDP